MSSLPSPRCPVRCSSSWLCNADLSSVLHVCGPESAARSRHQPAREECVTLEPPTVTEDDPACTLSLLCPPQGTARILDVTLCSEARTIEVYSCSQAGQEEEYLGTSRGDRDCTFPGNGGDSAVLFSAQFKLDVPAPACKVKLLSLGGRRHVLVSEISVGLTSIPVTYLQTPPPLLGSSINMELVQNMMDSMGRKMSPGAEQLMNMVQAQQKNQMPFGPHLLQMVGSFMSGRDLDKGTYGGESLRPHNAAVSRPETHPAACQQAIPSHFQSLMSSVLQKQIDKAANPESVLPLLQNLSLQKIQQEGSGRESCSMSREEKVDPALEKLLAAHMEGMERKLLSHIDQRMKRLQDHLDSRIDQLIHVMENSRFDRWPVTPADKLVNGHISHTPEQEMDSDELVGH